MPIGPAEPDEVIMNSGVIYILSKKKKKKKKKQTQLLHFLQLHLQVLNTAQ